MARKPKEPREIVVEIQTETPPAVPDPPKEEVKALPPLPPKPEPDPEPTPQTWVDRLKRWL